MAAGECLRAWVIMTIPDPRDDVHGGGRESRRAELVFFSPRQGPPCAALTRVQSAVMLGLLAPWATTQASTQCAGEHPLGEGPAVHNLNSFGATEESVVRFAPSVGPSCWCSLSSAESLQVWMGGNSESLPLMLRLWRRSEVLEPRARGLYK